ncbi:MAG: GNAT family N-acetyltransferase [Kiloniellales bacterium]|nr:GNAT family N-acetyltransferase [Kiloniellales bacterium]
MAAATAPLLGGALRTRLDNGVPVLIQPIGPDDGECLVRAFARLSDKTRYQRFFQARPGLTKQEVRYLTEVDQVNHLAWGAKDTSCSPPRGVGIARCIRLSDDPRVAELAITVVDDYQRQGAGALLLQVLMEAARGQGIESLTGQALAENRAALAMAESFGGSVVDVGAGLVRLGLDLRRASAA